MIYDLMRKNDRVVSLNISETGQISKVGKMHNNDLIPLQNRANRNNLVSWWNDRSIPIKQGKIAEMLRENGIYTPEIYLTQNLGLSLTDYYWIRPLGSELTWEQVNLFQNDFKENLLLGQIYLPNEGNPVLEYQPNSSLQGNIEKTWIIDKGQRKLIKGNHSELSSESINEVIISSAIHNQGKDAAQYDLIHIKNKPYDFGCISPMFTSEKLELVSAYAVITSEIKENHVSNFEHFINVCKKNGLDENYVREYLEFEILIDFIFTNRDRHLTNISVLRDADTLQFRQMAPIFDSGKSLRVGKELGKITDKLLLSQEITSFQNNELDLLKYVQNKSLINIDLLPTVDFVKEMYAKDSKVTEDRIKYVGELYKRKIDIYYQYANGNNLTAIKFAVTTPNEKENCKSEYENDIELD